MRSRLLIAVVSLLCTLALVGPAGAFNVGGAVGDCVLFADRQIAMEGGPTNITGNICVNQPKSVTGLNESIHVGQGNQINGTAFGDRVFTGNASSFIDTVNSNFVTGAGVVNTVISPATVTFPLVANLAQATGVDVLDFTCVTAAANVTVPAGGSQTIAPGCYKDVTVGNNATLTLDPAGTFTFRSVQIGIGGTFESPNGTSNVNVKNFFNSGASSSVSGMIIRTPAGPNQVVSIGNSSFFGATVFAPNGIVHIHFDSTFTGEVVGRKIIVQPTENVVDEVFCGCFEEVTKNNSTATLSGGFQLTKASGFFLSADCDLNGGDVSAPVQGVATDSTVVLNLAGLPAGTYHVIAKFDGSGTYCSEATITLP